MKVSTTSAKILKILIPPVFWLLLWQLAAMAVGKQLLLPSPIVALRALWQLAGSAEFWQAVGLTLLRICAGCCVGIILGIAAAALTCRFAPVRLLLAPLLRAMRAIPVASFIILVLLWVGRDIVPIFIVVLMVLPVVWSSTHAAMITVDKKLLELAKVYRFGKVNTLRLVYLPSVLPAVRAAVLTAVGLGWKSGVAAEVLCQPGAAIGTRLYYAKLYLETGQLFAWTAVVVILSLTLEKLISRAISGRKGAE